MKANSQKQRCLALRCSMIVVSEFITCDRQVNLCVYTYFL